MDDSRFWIHFGIWLVSGLGLCCLMARVSRQLRLAVSSLFAVFYAPLNNTQQRASDFLRDFYAWLSGQLGQEAVNNGDSPVYFIIGSFFYTTLTVLFVLCDFGLIVLTFQAMGMDAADTFEFPVDTSTLSAGTLICSALFWGLILGDLFGVTHLGPWKKALSQRQQLALGIISALMISAVILLAVCGGLWRSDSLEQVARLNAEQSSPGQTQLFSKDHMTKNEAGLMLGGNPAQEGLGQEPPFLSGSGAWIVKSTMMGIAGLSIVSTAASGVGVVIFTKFLMLFSIWLVLVSLWVVSIAAAFCMVVVDALFRFASALFDLLIAVGEQLLRILPGRFQPAREPTRVPSQGQSQPRPGSHPEPESESENPPQEQPSDRPDNDPGFNPFKGGPK